MSKRIITLGTWDDKPIEWYVVKEEKYRKLLFSRLALFSLCLSWNGKSGTWCDSSLRSFLNGEFYNKAFTKAEKKIIINSFLEDPESTKDDVFLLSYDEANNILTTDERKCGNGSWCNYHNCQNDCYKYSDKHGTCTYLRTPSDSNRMKTLHPNGSSYESKNGWLSIRPAMWIREK
jgi:hypothetical protein